jgi:hypothetical protein
MLEGDDAVAAIEAGCPCSRRETLLPSGERHTEQPTKHRPIARTHMREDQIRHLVNRFLGSRVPENFSPDGGTSFKAEFNEHTAHPMKHQPTGTNLLDAPWAEAMVRHITEGLV